MPACSVKLDRGEGGVGVGGGVGGVGVGGGVGCGGVGGGVGGGGVGTGGGVGCEVCSLKTQQPLQKKGVSSNYGL